MKVVEHGGVVVVVVVVGRRWQLSLKACRDRTSECNLHLLSNSFGSQHCDTDTESDAPCQF